MAAVRTIKWTSKWVSISMFVDDREKLLMVKFVYGTIKAIYYESALAKTR